MTHTVYLTTTESKRIALFMDKPAPGHYRLVGAAGFESLKGQNLCFDLELSGPEAHNLDFTSESFSCFRLSEQVRLPELTIQDDYGQYADPVEGHAKLFLAANLQQLQQGLDRLRGKFIDSAEY